MKTVIPRDGLIMDLLAAEITARTGKDPGERYRELTAELEHLDTIVADARTIVDRAMGCSA